MLSNTFSRLRIAARTQNGLVQSGHRFSSTSSTLAGPSTDTATTSSTNTPATPASRTTHYRVTLRRSAIGLPKNIGLVLQSLGLRKRLQSVFHPHHPKFAGMILAVKELVHVENVRRLDGGVKKAAEVMAERIRSAGLESDKVHEIAPLIVRKEHAVWVNENGEVVDWGGRPSRKAPRGYTVVGNVVNEKRNREIQAERMIK